jgi:pyruvate/2-oxoglutarate dehydrogenase complex dihydrolipoamide dehydrogenase (E3) component/uncharacterized membrane protein YdjX (TVP38/TMEM64 family)
MAKLHSKHTQPIKRAFLVALLLAAVSAFFYFDLGQYLSFASLKSQRETLLGLVQENPVQAALAFFAIYVLAAALSIPGAGVLTIAGGALFGLLTGTVLVSFASSIGALLAFWSARFLFRDYVKTKFGERLAPIERGIEKDGAFYLLTLRLVPAVPFFAVNLLMGLTNIKSRTYYGISQIGMLLGTVAYVYAGTQIARIDSPADIVSPGLLAAFAAVGLMPLALRKLSQWFASRRVYRGHRKPDRFDYNLIAIGAGSGGLVTAYIGAAVKARVALVEKHRMGGDCLNTGCVPSKALIRSAKLLHDASNSRKYGIANARVEFDFADVMQRVSDVVRRIEPHDSVERYTGLGVDCLQGHARLVSPWEVDVDGRRISARSIVIATGARPLVPNIPGLTDVPYLTSDTLWELRELPERLLVLGGGPIGCELAQSFARFGSRVTQVEMLPRLLPREDADVSAAILRSFADEGIRVATAHKALRIEKDADGDVLVCEHEGMEVRFGFDRILLALGRKPNIEGFGLQELGVAISPRGTVQTNEKMQTNFPNIYAVGDVAGPYQFTHTASHQAWYAAINGLLSPFWSFDVDYRTIPWTTFSDPEVARVGLSEQEAKERGIAYEVTEYGIDDLDRAIADGTDRGFVKVLTAPGKDKILGAVIVGAHAGDVLAEFVLAMKHGLGLNKILGTIHTYPTMAEANKYAAGVWKRANAPQRALKWADKFFAWRIAGPTRPSAQALVRATRNETTAIERRWPI